MNYDVGTINKCLSHLPDFKYTHLPPPPTTPFLTKKYQAVRRGRNSGRLLAKSGSNYHLADSVNFKISEKSQIKTINFCKMIADCFI